MFEKLNQLIKENVKAEVFLNAGIAHSLLESAVNEASGVIVDVLKSQLDSGKAKDLMMFFKSKESECLVVAKIIIYKYSNRLNKYYNLSSEQAKGLSQILIPVVLNKFIKQTIDSKKEEKGVFALLNWLSGNTVNFEDYFLKINKMQIA